MRRPIWSLEMVRSTNAPFETVSAALLAPERAWHPRPGRSPFEVLSRDDGHLELRQTERPCWGVEELATYRVEACEGRLLLRYRARFKGWPVLILMGYWHLRSHRIWERFVEAL